MKPSRIVGGSATAAVAAAAIIAPAASAQDMTIDEVLVTQGIRFPSTQLVGGNVTFVRVLIESNNFGGSTPNVDALLRVFIQDEEADFSPLRPINGPFTSPFFPMDEDLNDHLNFAFVAPTSFNVDLRIVVDPNNLVDDPDLSNNVATVDNLWFRCRGIVDLPYVPINYTQGGGLPDAELIRPGVGDAFTRMIFKPQNWNYFESPLGPLTWTQNINGSSSQLLNTLSDIRQDDFLPAGYPRPPLIYGWLPGNPFSGNGQANGIPGDAAFGNTQGSRYQRTFAHEVGHLLGEGHNNERSDTIVIDVEHHLRDPLNIPQLRGPNELDVMVAGQQTEAAFVSRETYEQTNSRAIFNCSVADAPAAQDARIRISGVIDHATSTVALDATRPFPPGEISGDLDAGTVFVVTRDVNGRPTHIVQTALANTREPCTDPSHNHAWHGTSPLHVMVPEMPGGEPIASIDVIDASNGNVMARMDRSFNAPSIAFTGIRPAAKANFGQPAPLRTGTVIDQPVVVSWVGDDADGDDLTYTLQYAHNGERWRGIPSAMGIADNSFELDPQLLPRGEEARLRLVASDGLNTTIVDSATISMLGSGAPSMDVITPNQFSAVRERAPLILHGYSFDREDETIADQIVWTSSIDGEIGVGRLLMVDSLSVGTHTITGTVTDSNNNTVSDSRVVQITARLFPDADLNDDGPVDFTDLLSMLSAFGPCGDFCGADLDLDDAVSFTDVLSLLSAWTG
ncbi:MAG: hypothetical protein AB8G96_17230 [Phycisphaerales bacterium]